MIKARAAECVAFLSGDHPCRWVILDDAQLRILRMRDVAELAGLLRRDGQAPVFLDAMHAAISRAAARG